MPEENPFQSPFPYELAPLPRRRHFNRLRLLSILFWAVVSVPAWLVWARSSTINVQLGGCAIAMVAMIAMFACLIVREVLLWSAAAAVFVGMLIWFTISQ